VDRGAPVTARQLPTDRPLRLTAAALRLGVSTRTVLRYIAAGKLLATKLPSGHWRVHESAIRACLDAREVVA
jgi:excisionase family DNA binding protein